MNTRSHLNNRLHIFVFAVDSPGIVIDIATPVFISSVGIVVDSGMAIEGCGIDMNEKLQPRQKLFVVGLYLRKIVMPLFSDQSERFF